MKSRILIIGISAVILLSYLGYVSTESQRTCMSLGGVWQDGLCGPTIEGKSIDSSTAVNTDNIVDANNRFALSFYSYITHEEENNDQNIFFSPTSVSTAFAIVYEGARENTAKEIQDIFGFLEDDNKRRSEFASLYNKLNEKDAKHKLQIANALWIADHFQPLPSYVDIVMTHYNSKVDSVDFITDNGVNTINKWVASETEDKITELFPSGSTDENTALVITNAIYFLGTWENQFNPHETIMREFTTSSGKTIKVPTMYLDKKMLNHMQNEQLEILELPYIGDKLSMLILLPNNVDGLKPLEESITTENLTQWTDQLEERLRSVYVPKFTLETDYDLKEHLLGMGMHDAFDKNNANFTGISDRSEDKIYLGKAIHKAFVDVNEVGTEAAAATGVEARLQSGAPIFRADHPFIFLIQDRETQNILFMGRIIDPTE